tara:strand:+ start:224 stop:451 length:228 start_codon:yes stop_codon:yes gene_type:complete
MENTLQPSNPQPPANEKQPERVNLDELKVENQEMALNLMGQFLELAQKRGAFNFQESAKIYECVKFFMPPPQAQP